MRRTIVSFPLNHFRTLSSTLSLNRVITAIAILFLPLLYFYPAVKGELALVQGDGWAANLGLRILTGKMLAQGIFPLWNPYLFGGMPLLASIYPGVLYPPNWLFVLFRPEIAMTMVVITTYHLAFIGTYRYARALRLNRFSALIAGIIFTFGGYMVMSMGQTSNIATAAHLPWVLLAIEKLYRQVSWRWILLGAVFISLQFFAGVPQVTWYTVLVGGSYFLFSVLFRVQQQPRWHFTAGTMTMSICGALLSTIQLLPLRELQQEGGRAKLSYEYFSAFSFPPRQIFALIFPYFFGGASLWPYRTPYWGQSGIFVTCGYIGLLGLLLVIVALLDRRKQAISWYWFGVATISLALSFGDYLPFGLNHLLYHIPIYNLFRASFRHTFEFTFACAVIAGLGANYLTEGDREKVGQTLKIGIVVLIIIVLITLIAYLFGGRYLAYTGSRPPRSSSLSNPEILIPLFFFLASVIALWRYTQSQTKFSAILVVTVLFADLVAYGQFLEWRTYTFNVAERLKDPPSVKYIKSQETDLNSFRILSYSTLPFGANYELLNYPNNSIARGLQSANGYDMLRMQRSATVMGDMTPEGVVQNYTSFDEKDQGYNLLNIKYLIFERIKPLDAAGTVTYEGVHFDDRYLELGLAPGGHVEMQPGGVPATELAIVSTMSNSANLPDGEPVVKISIHTKGEQIIEKELCIGRDTSEWAYDRDDVRSIIKHSRARVAESWPVADKAGSFQAHRYLARLSFDKTDVEKVVFRYLRSDAEIVIMRASLYDSTVGLSYPLAALQLPSERWQKLKTFGPVDIYRNLKALPRVWFVKSVMVAPSAEVIHKIREGKDPSGEPFNPAEVALLEKEDLEERIVPPKISGTVDSEAVITSYAPQQIEIKTRNRESGFLVLSEIYYPGWEAKVDGVKAEIYRADYILRGLMVPSGEHRIEFVYVPSSFRRGSVYSSVTILLLLVGACYVRLRPLRKA